VAASAGIVNIEILSLPEPPPERSGWPWNGEPSSIAHEGSLPRISVVIPTFNQGTYIEETIRSILLQDYPNQELIIIDGGSNDETLLVIKKYEPWITYWVSEKDRGQTHAINKGFDRATGDWVAWMNSDDLYQPMALHALAQAAELNPQADVIFGNKESFNSDGSFRQAFIACTPDFHTMLPWQCIYSESTFFKRTTVLNEIRPNESFHHYMDSDFFWRLFLGGKRFHHVPFINAKWRIHAGSKSIKGKDIADEERFQIMLSVLSDPRTPHSEHAWVVHHLVHESLNTFGKRMFQKFREQVRALARCIGCLRVPSALWFRYLVSPFMIWKRRSTINPDLESKNVEPYRASKVES